MRPQSLSLILLPRLALIAAVVALALGAILIQERTAAADSGDTGSAKTFNVAKVNQKNIQIIAGHPDNRNNTTQTAINFADIEQSATAISTGSGDALARNTAIVNQKNIQIVAGRGCSADQTAINYAEVDQTAVAVAGDGDATATNKAVVNQRNFQLHVCERDGGGHVNQEALNVAIVEQEALAVSAD